MIKNITLYIFLLFSIVNIFSQEEQVARSFEDFNGFSTRNFMKFNSFLTVPTFSVLHRDNETIEAIVRSSNIEFEDASRLHALSYSGKVRERTGAGVAVFQQEIGVFKDFGAIFNYAYQIQLGAKTKLALGFNFLYSRRGLNSNDVLTQVEDVLVSNFQDIPIINVQPAITFSYGKYNLGVFFEDLAYFNLKNSEFASEFTEKTISAHVGYSNKFDNFSGLLENSYLRILAIARTSQLNGFSYAGNILMDLPKAGWLKVGYDNLYGINAGLGVNLSERLSVGFTYEKTENLSATNEIGLLYTLGKRKPKGQTRSNKPTVRIELPNSRTEPLSRGEQTEKGDTKYIKGDDLSDELRRAQDSLNSMNRKLDSILKKLSERPKEIVKEVVRVEAAPTPVRVREPRSQELRRNYDSTPWRDKSQSVKINGGGAGTMHYVAVDQFKSLSKVKALVENYKKRKVKVRYVREPKTNTYFVYVNRHAKEEDAEEEKQEVNGGRIGGGENDIADDLGIKKSVYKDPVYVVKITLGAAGETRKVPKTQPRAKVRTMRLIDGLEEGYYLQVNVFSKKDYADRFLDELNSDGIDADYFLNPVTGNRHVYILKTNDRAEAIRQYDSNLDGAYYDRKSIINIL